MGRIAQNPLRTEAHHSLLRPLFSLTAEAGEKTRIDQELILEPKGMFNILVPFMGAIARKNLKDTAAALKNYLES